MTNFATQSRVRLTEAAREVQSDIGHAIGIVHDASRGIVQVDWPRGRSWHKETDVEPA